MKKIIFQDNPATGTAMDWPPYILDVSLCDYFLWCTLQGIVFQNKSATPEELEELYCEACAPIYVDTLYSVTEYFILSLCCYSPSSLFSTAKGAHFESISL